MPEASINGVKIYYEDYGEGFPLIWSHEFAGDFRSWRPQVRFFSRRYRVITYNARGYPPSEVPTEPEAYSQPQAVEDLHQLMRYLGIEQAYIGGLSMGGNIALNFGLRYPEMVRALIIASTGAGSVDPEGFRRQGEELSRRLMEEGMAAMSGYINGPSRRQLLRKDPSGFEEFSAQLFEHSNIGSALTFRGVQCRRPPIFELEDQMRKLEVPVLIMIGDEDDECIEPALAMKRAIPRSGLVAFPQSGHAINLEEPDLFNRMVLDFLTAVEAGKWAKRDAEPLPDAALKF